MPRFSLCRVCLASDVTVYNILNSCLQEMYEKLTRLPLHDDDGKPHTVCCLCLSLLRNSYTLWVKSVTADRLLTRLLARGNELSLDSIKQIDREEHKLAVVLTITTQHHVDIKSEEYEVPVKVESEEVKVEYQGFSDADRVSNKDDSDTDSEDDVPLQTISVQNKLSAEKKGAKDEEFLKGFKSGYARELLLTKAQQLQELQERGTSPNYLNAPFQCPLCCRGYIEAGAFRNHQDKHDAKSGAHVCDVCSMRYKTARKLRAHAVTAHERRYQCLSCPHRAHTASQAREHEKWHRGHTYECTLCGHKSRKSTSHLTHMRARHRTAHVCARCGDSFVGAHGLRMHASKAHRGDQLQPPEESPAEERYCPECDIQFESLLAWKRHILSSVNHAFGKGNNGVCVICGPACPGNGVHLKESVKALRPTNRAPALRTTSVACEQCGSSFATSSKLQAHVKRVHLGVKYNKNVVCEVCGKKCTSNASLKYHQRTHTGEKPHKCETCDKRFADSNQLRIHTRRHTGERPYCCRHCRRSFTQKPALNRHYRVHTGAKPYSCQYCAKNFSQSNSLKLHVRTVHLKLPNNKKRNAQEVEKKEEKIE